MVYQLFISDYVVGDAINSFDVFEAATTTAIDTV